MSRRRSSDNFDKVCKWNQLISLCLVKSSTYCWLRRLSQRFRNFHEANKATDSQKKEARTGAGLA
jgi:hypothetical protein